MNHYTGNITPGKDIIFVFGSNPEGKHGAGDIPDNIWFSEEWYKAITKQVQNAFMEQLDGREPYYYWKEIPPTKIWYDETDNCFHTSDGITHEFKGYELDDMRFCLQDLYLKIIATYKSKGIVLHDEIED